MLNFLKICYQAHRRGWGRRFECRLSLMGPRRMVGVPSVRGLSNGSQPGFTRVSKKSTKNSERIGRQARPEIEHGNSRLQAFQRRTTQPLLEPSTDTLTSIPQPGFKLGIFGVTAGSPNHCTTWSAPGTQITYLSTIQTE